MLMRFLKAVWRWIGIRGLILVFVLLVCGLLLTFNLVLRPKMIAGFFASQKAPAVAVSTVEVKPTTWTPEIDAIGTLWAFQGVDVASETAGIVKEIAFTANQHVDKGQLLVQLDDAVESADMMSVQAAVARDRSQLERAKSLRASGVNSLATLQDSESALAASQSALAKVQAVLNQKSIEAPFAGIIGIPRIDDGQYVQAGTVIATLQQLDKMKVDFTVPEQQVGQIEIGQPAKFGLTGADFAYDGRIIGVDPKIDPQTRLVSVRAEVDNPNAELRPGQFVRVRVGLPPIEDVIALPQTSVVTSLYGDYVYVVEPQEPDDTAQGGDAAANAAGETEPSAPDQVEALVAKQVFVQTGRRQGDLIQVESGVSAGQTVVTSGQNKLANNSPVTINNAANPATVASDGGDEP